MTCLDGREFIRTAVRDVLDNPFPPYVGLKLSKREIKEGRRMRQQIQMDESGNKPTPIPTEPPPPPVYPQRNRVSHFVMNLPDSAIEFLDAFRGVLSRANAGQDLEGVYRQLPMVHCHCFTRCLDVKEADADIRQVSDEPLS